MGYLIGFIVLVVILYIIFGKGKLPTNVRTWFKGESSKAADNVETVDDDVTAARDAQAGIVQKGREGLFEIQQELGASEIQLGHVNDQIDDLNKAIALAHRNGDQETFNVLVGKLNAQTQLRAQFETDHTAIMTQLKGLEVTVDQERAKKDLIESQSRVMVSQARVNNVSASINQARAALDSNGSGALMAKAQKALDRSGADAIASQRAAEGLTEGERSDRRAAEYIAQAKTNVNAVDADSLWKQMDDTSAQPKQ